MKDNFFIYMLNLFLILILIDIRTNVLDAKNAILINQEELRLELSKIGKVDLNSRPCRPWDACVQK